LFASTAIIEVFHARVSHAELHDCFDLLCHDSLAWICSKPRRWEIEHGRYFYENGLWCDRIAEADVNLEVDLRRRDPCDKRDANASVLLLFSDERCLQRGHVEADTVVRHRDNENVGEHLAHARNSDSPKPRRSRSRVGRCGIPVQTANNVAPFKTNFAA
jgi:hypothetical protein